VATLHLSCAADRVYAPHSAAMLHSMLGERGRLEVQVHYLHGPSFPQRTRRRLAEMVERLGGHIQFLEVSDERVRGLPTFEEISAAMWYRIYLPELLPDVERVLYLDGDVLALDSLEPLWDAALGDRLVAAVSNVFTLDPAARARPAALGLPDPAAYFNSGVLLLNLEEMRRDATTAKLRRFALSNELMYPDQDALNAVMAERRLPLHPRWNCMNSVLLYPWAEEVFGAQALEEARRRPAIRHFEGPSMNKPWHRDCRQEGRELYFHHRRATPWRRVRLVGQPRRRRTLGPLRWLRRSVSA
jgi:lipopolysaccharide biosynthesis glycosyltransferase